MKGENFPGNLAKPDHLSKDLQYSYFRSSVGKKTHAVLNQVEMQVSSLYLTKKHDMLILNINFNSSSGFKREATSTQHMLCFVRVA